MSIISKWHIPPSIKGVIIYNTLNRRRENSINNLKSETFQIAFARSVTLLLFIFIEFSDKKLTVLLNRYVDHIQVAYSTLY